MQARSKRMFIPYIVPATYKIIIVIKLRQVTVIELS